MRSLKQYFAFFLLVSLVAACAPMQRTQIPTNPAEAQKLAQEYINEANTTLIAVANVVTQNRKDGVITAVERDAYVAKLREFSKKVDDAQALLRTGDLSKAFNQAELLKTLIVALHREVAAKARKQ